VKIRTLKQKEHLDDNAHLEDNALRSGKGLVFFAGALSLLASGFASFLYGCGSATDGTIATIGNDGDVEDDSSDNHLPHRSDAGFFCDLQQDDCPSGSVCNAERRCEPGCKSAKDCDEATAVCLPTHRCGCASGLVEAGDGVCSNFGGAFEISDPGCAACNNVNAFIGAASCGCPSGFLVSPSNGSSARVINDCNSTGGQHGGYIKFCEGSGFTQKNDWAGAYEKDDDNVPGSLGCRRKNTYTQDCTCPAGTEAMTFRVMVDSPKGGLSGSNLTMCLNRAAPTNTFGGAYQLDDDVPGGSGCRVKNVATQACSCPTGTRPTSYRVEVESKNGGFTGSKVFVCIP